MCCHALDQIRSLFLLLHLSNMVNWIPPKLLTRYFRLHDFNIFWSFLDLLNNFGFDLCGSQGLSAWKACPWSVIHHWCNTKSALFDMFCPKCTWADLLKRISESWRDGCREIETTEMQKNANLGLSATIWHFEAQECLRRAFVLSFLAFWCLTLRARASRLVCLVPRTVCPIVWSGPWQTVCHLPFCSLQFSLHHWLSICLFVWIARDFQIMFPETWLSLFRSACISTG